MAQLFDAFCRPGPDLSRFVSFAYTTHNNHKKKEALWQNIQVGVCAATS
ncbi:MAG: DNA polymerase III psi subunit, partial [Candidatus Azotimanducaceae bacterium]